MAKKLESFVTGNCNTVFSNLNKVDNFKKTRTHNITVELSKELSQTLEEIAADVGAKKINGISTTKDGTRIIKFKNKKSPDAGESFPCVDSKGKATALFPFGGDVVRLRIWPLAIKDDDGTTSVSFLLFGCQIIEKKPYTKRENDFDEVEGGFVDAGPTPNPRVAPTSDTEDEAAIPF